MHCVCLRVSRAEMACSQCCGRHACVVLTLRTRKVAKPPKTSASEIPICVDCAGARAEHPRRRRARAPDLTSPERVLRVPRTASSVRKRGHERGRQVAHRPPRRERRREDDAGQGHHGVARGDQGRGGARWRGEVRVGQPAPRRPDQPRPHPAVRQRHRVQLLCSCANVC